ncbi:MAG: phosphodiester glycosidase family protein [Chloroflexota bacterium]
MKRLVFLSVALVALIMVMVALGGAEAPPSQPQPQQETQDPDWERLAPGIEYRRYRLPEPNNVYVARMEISRTNVTLESAVGSGYLASGVETVRSMASRYDDALSQWGVSDGWGSARSNVVVAVNGDYFNGSGLPHGGMVQAGWYIKRFNDYGGRTGFGWKFSRTPFVGECVVHQPEKQFVQFADGSTQRLDGINVDRDSNQLIFYTPQYDQRTHTADDGVEILVTLKQPAIIYPAPRAFTGTITEIRSGQGSTPMLFDQAVLSANGDAADELLAHVIAGQAISISQEIASRQEFDCDAPLAGIDWSKTYASVGGDYYFLKESQPKTYDCSQTPGFCNRLPRTAIAYNERYVYFIVVDGRDWIDSLGMTVPELTVFARETLSATYGVTQDGGGSSTMVINGEVVNNTFCNNYTCRAKIYLPIAVNGVSAPSMATARALPSPTPRAGPPQADSLPATFDAPGNSSYQRGVANGMMMVVVEPEQRSEISWAEGQAVVMASAANLRLGPGTNYASQGVMPAGAVGAIQPHNLNGIFAKGYFWWRVRLESGLEGWIVEDALSIP